MSISLLFFVNSCHDSILSGTEQSYKFNCDASHDSSDVKKKHHHLVYGGKNILVNLAGTQSSKEYHSPPTSILLNDKSKYSFVTTIEGVKRDERYIISIWLKGPLRKGSLVVEASPKEILYEGTSIPIEKGENGWNKLQLDVEIPPGIHTIKFYAYNRNNDSVYFDDLTVEKISTGKDYDSYIDHPKLHLYFSEDAMVNFEEERKKAFLEGVHFSNENWTKGILSDENDILPIKSRFKGDWLDHLEGRKWSFRIKTRKNKAFRRMTSFAVQSPKSRYFLHEYIAHNLFIQEGLLTTRYDFAPLYVNGKSLGLYAIEEHFEKQLIEYNLRKEGLLLKLDENPSWRAVARYVGTNKNSYYQILPRYDVSRVLPFKLGKVLKDSSLKSQFLIAQRLVYQFKDRTGPIEEIFDVDKLAKYLALIDIVNGKHGISWHNLRFYYNPALCKLEPVNYDNFAENPTHELPNAFPHPLIFISNKQQIVEHNLYPSLFRSKQVVEKYMEYLEYYSQEAFIRKYNQTQNEAIERYLPMIQKEFPIYSIDSNFLLENAQYIRSKLSRLKERYDSGFFENLELNDSPHLSDYVKDSTILACYTNSYYFKQGNEAKIYIENYNGVKMELIGLMGENNQLLYNFPPNSTVGPFKNTYADTLISLPYFDKATKLVFQPLDTSFVIKSELSLWEKSTSLSPYQKLLKASQKDSNSIFTERNDSLFLFKGDYTLSNRILIPKGKPLTIEAGVNLNMINRAAIISYSAVHLNGSKAKPISIYSSDSTSNGFSVLQASNKSKLSYTTFTGLNTFNYEGWSLSGAVNFYESDVVIEHCEFQKNVCEDALNIIRSNFEVNSSTFSNIYADAFDSDFSTGIVDGVTFNNIGNDAIDFSTSEIKIQNCSITNVSDKGISGGEASTLEVKDCSILNCNIGIASKDLSTIQIQNTSINGCTYGLVAFKKKAEYGPASIVGNQISIEDCPESHLIEKGSTLTLNSKKVVGSKKKVAEMFY